MARLFVAVELPEHILSAFESWQKWQKFRFARWVARENLHITAYFFGDVEEGRVSELVHKLKETCSSAKPFTLEFDEIILAPPHRDPNMIWAVFKPSAEFDALANALNRGAKSGAKNGQTPHVTLARMKALLDSIVKLNQPDIQDRIIEIKSCALFESKLTPDGPIYSKIAVFDFSL